MIHLILGRQGSGKTLFIVKKAYDAYKAGKIIYSNVHLKFPYKKLNYKDVINCRLENAVVILDEIHQLLPARNSTSRRNREICDSFLSMVRKKGLEIYGTTQTPRKVDIRFREEADYWYMCRKFAFIKGNFIEIISNDNLNPKIPIIVRLDVQEMITGNTINISFTGNSYFDLYDTTQVIIVEGI